MSVHATPTRFALASIKAYFSGFKGYIMASNFIMDPLIQSFFLLESLLLLSAEILHYVNSSRIFMRIILFLLSPSELRRQERTGKKAIGWVSKMKAYTDGSIYRYMARLVAKGYTQIGWGYWLPLYICSCGQVSNSSSLTCSALLENRWKGREHPKEKLSNYYFLFCFA